MKSSLTGRAFDGVLVGMTTRLLVFLLVSACIHVLVLAQPWTLMVVSENESRKPPILPVNLVEDGREAHESAAEEEEGREEEQDGGITFEVEGEVSADYMDLLKARIFEAWEYPDDAVRNGAEGIVRVAFILNASGRPAEIGVVRSSGNTSLDEAAVNAIRKAAPFGPFTEDISTKTLKITGNFCYILD